MESTSDYPLAWTPSRSVRTLLRDMAPASVGKRLKQLRERRGFTQDQLADMVGVKERTVSRWETGASRGLYDDDVLDEIAKALGCEPEDIIGPRAVPPAELHDLKQQLDRIEANQRKILRLADQVDALDAFVKEAVQPALERVETELLRRDAPAA